MLVKTPTQICLHLIKDQTNCQNLFAVSDLKDRSYKEVKKNEFLCLKKLSRLGTEILKIGRQKPVLEVYVLEETK